MSGDFKFLQGSEQQLWDEKSLQPFGKWKRKSPHMEGLHDKFRYYMPLLGGTRAAIHPAQASLKPTTNTSLLFYRCQLDTWEATQDRMGTLENYSRQEQQTLMNIRSCLSCFYCKTGTPKRYVHFYVTLSKC